MKSNLLIPADLLFYIALFGAIFSIFTVSFDLTSLGIPLVAGNFLMYIALLCNFVVAILLIIDVFRNNLSTKYLWTLGFLLTAGIAGVIYLRRRDYLQLS